MNILFSWADAPAAHTLGRVLLHTLWQAPLVAAALWLALKTLPAARARLRHGAAAAALAAVVIAAACTHGVLGLPAPTATPIVTAAPAPPPASPQRNTVPPVAPSSNRGLLSKNADVPTASSTPWPALALLTWAAVASLLIARTLLALLATRRLTRGPGVTRVEPWAHDVLADLQRRLRVRRAVRLVASAATHTPVVLGALFPVIVLPPTLAAGLTTQQMRVVLAHELAHIKRHDYLLNLAQRLVEALLFFNPAVWFIGRQIRLEREAACDSAAAEALQGDRLHVARTLVDVLQQLTVANAQPTAALALGQPHEPALTQRIARLLNPHRRDAARIPWPTLALLITLAAAALYGVACGSEATATALDKIVNPEKYVVETRATVAASEVIVPQGRTDGRGQTLAEDTVTVRGTVRTADGSPLPRHTHVSLRSESARSNYNMGIAPTTDPQDPSLATFEAIELPPGRVTLMAHSRDHAPSILPPRIIHPGHTSADHELILGPGFAQPIHVTNTQGKPLAGARFSDTFLQLTPSSGTGTRAPQPTDAQGRTALDHAGPHLYTLTVDHPGHESRRFKLRGDAQTPWKIQLAPALPIVGTVTDATTRRPVPNASVHLFYNATDHRSNDPRLRSADDLPLATTDARGDFVVNTLSRHVKESGHTLWIEAPGYAPMLLYDVLPSQDTPPLSVALRPAISFTVRINDIADHRDALQHRGKITVSLNQSVEYRPFNRYGHRFKSQIDPQTGVALFEDLLIEGHATLYVGKQTFKIPDLRAAAQAGPFEVDIPPASAAPPPTPTRRVVINLQAPDGWPPPQGTLNVSHHGPGPNGHRFAAPLAITDGKARLDVLLNERPQFTVKDLVAPGYWIPSSNGQNGDDHHPVPAGEGDFNITLPVYPAGVVTGRVLDRQGQPVPHARLGLKELTPAPEGRIDNNRYHDFTTDADGRFLITPIPFAGRYRITADPQDADRFYEAWSEPFSATPQQPRPQVTLHLPTTHAIRLTVRTPGGRPAPAAPVDISLATDEGSQGWSPALTTNGDGQITLPSLNFGLPGATWSAQIGPHGDGQPQRVVFSSDEPNPVVTLERGVTATGQLINDANGLPLPNVQVRAVVPTDETQLGRDFDFAHDIFTTTTSTDGRFTLRGLIPGRTYRVQLGHRHYEPQALNYDATGTLQSSSSDRATRFTTPTTPANPLTLPKPLRVVVNPWNH